MNTHAKQGKKTSEVERVTAAYHRGQNIFRRQSVSPLLKYISELEALKYELAEVLYIASLLNINPAGNSILWGNPSPFQEKINRLLIQAGRSLVTAPNTVCTGQVAGTTASPLSSTSEPSPVKVADTEPAATCR